MDIAIEVFLWIVSAGSINISTCELLLVLRGAPGKKKIETVNLLIIDVPASIGIFSEKFTLCHCPGWFEATGFAHCLCRWDASLCRNGRLSILDILGTGRKMSPVVFTTSQASSSSRSNEMAVRSWPFSHRTCWDLWDGSWFDDFDGRWRWKISNASAIHP